MSIQEYIKKLKGFLKNDEVYTTALVILVGVAAFGLGRGIERSETAISAASGDVSVEERAVERAEANLPGEYVASKNGARYHLPWCGSASQIKEENKVWFDTREAAEAAGYTPAVNCEGL